MVSAPIKLSQGEAACELYRSCARKVNAIVVGPGENNDRCRGAIDNARSAESIEYSIPRASLALCTLEFVKESDSYQLLYFVDRSCNWMVAVPELSDQTYHQKGWLS